MTDAVRVCGAIDKPALRRTSLSASILADDMPTVVLANRKGGVGKTLSTLYPHVDGRGLIEHVLDQPARETHEGCWRIQFGPPTLQRPHLAGRGTTLGPRLADGLLTLRIVAQTELTIGQSERAASCSVLRVRSAGLLRAGSAAAPFRSVPRGLFPNVHRQRSMRYVVIIASVSTNQRIPGRPQSRLSGTGAVCRPRRPVSSPSGRGTNGSLAVLTPSGPSIDGCMRMVATR